MPGTIISDEVGVPVEALPYLLRVALCTGVDKGDKRLFDLAAADFFELLDKARPVVGTVLAGLDPTRVVGIGLRGGDSLGFGDLEARRVGDEPVNVRGETGFGFCGQVCNIPFVKRDVGGVDFQRSHQMTS